MKLWPALLVAGILTLAVPPLARAAVPPCTECAKWNASQKPLRIYGDTYYVGPRGLSSILITSAAGHVLIDGDLPESASQIAAHIRELGFRVEDVKLILNTHVHFDHAGGIAALQRMSGAIVTASPESAAVLRSGRVGRNDPQYGVIPSIERVRNVRVVHDGETLHVGPIAVTAHFTGGHTPGGTSWSWQSCEAKRCLDIVYADSLTPVSADSFHYSKSRAYPNALSDFERSFRFLESAPCDILLAPHPDAAGFWERVTRRDGGDRDALIDRDACRHYAGRARNHLRERLDKEAHGIK